MAIRNRPRAPLLQVDGRTNRKGLVAPMLKAVMVMYLNLLVVMVVEMVRTRVGATNPLVDLAMSVTALVHTLSKSDCLMVDTISREDHILL